MSPNSIIPVAHRSFLLGWHIIIRFNWSQSKLSNFKIIILNAPLILPMAPVRFNVLKEIWHRYITYNSVDEEVREIDKGDQLCGKFPYRWKLNFWWWACCIVGYLSLLLGHFSRVRLSVTPWTMARQAPLSMGFSRQEHRSGLPFPSPNSRGEGWMKRWALPTCRPHGTTESWSLNNTTSQSPGQEAMLCGRGGP